MLLGLVMFIGLVLTIQGTGLTLARADSTPVVLEADIDPIGRTVTIIGEQFGDSTPLVMVDGVPLVVTSWTETVIAVALPEHAAPAEECTVEVRRGQLMDEHATLRLEMVPLEERLRRVEP